jgi:formamidopyrimidine-DNA glycosylase
MPELPEVETVVIGLREQVLGKQISNVIVNYKPIVRSDLPYFKQTLKDNKIAAIHRHGKYIFMELKDQKLVVIHLRMTGQLFLADDSDKRDKHTHLEILLKDSKKKIVYRDIRKFGRFELIDKKDLENYITSRKLAQDALSISFDQFYSNIKNKSKGLKALLLDQTIIAGLGNIYVDEVLIREKLSPLTRPADLDKAKIKNLLVTIKKVLKKAILKKGTTFSDYVTSYGSKGKFQLSLKAYKCDGKPCPHCGSVICKTRVAGRGTYFCPECQGNIS